MDDNAKINPTMSQPGYQPENPPPYAAGQPHYYGHPPPPGPYGPPLIGAAVIPTVVPMVVGTQMSPKPTPLTCRSCNAQIVTRVEIRSTTKTHLFALLLCLFGCWPCVCIPYCMDSCNNAEHYCPNCNSYIGSYQS
ncbi:hypothetical protein K1T71_004939 [Dendrolimus kikuchii]|uniref:Uncharacterized protein n=1 Tax=Dendrolimus kikuchii TaxID=765133 RepID=A0ACC1D765_9NEOP|nr:hypothetical protein K1T71_004939 [Dendrolimus kikuchii]